MTLQSRVQRLEANFEGGKSTAYNYIQLFKGWPELEANFQRVGTLSLRQALELMKPKSENEAEADEPEAHDRAAIRL